MLQKDVQEEPAVILGWGSENRKLFCWSNMDLISLPVVLRGVSVNNL